MCFSSLSSFFSPFTFLFYSLIPPIFALFRSITYNHHKHSILDNISYTIRLYPKHTFQHVYISKIDIYFGKYFGENTNSNISCCKSKQRRNGNLQYLRIKCICNKIVVIHLNDIGVKMYNFRIYVLITENLNIYCGGIHI